MAQFYALLRWSFLVTLTLGASIYVHEMRKPEAIRGNPFQNAVHVFSEQFKEIMHKDAQEFIKPEDGYRDTVKKEWKTPKYFRNSSDKNTGSIIFLPAK